MTTAQSDTGASIALDSEFARELRALIHLVRPRRILETGTLHAMGTTRIIGESLTEFGITADFRSIEVNADNFDVAKGNATVLKLPVTIEHGLSIPRDALLSADQIAVDLAAMPDTFVADYEPGQRISAYLAETNYPGVPDDLIGKVLADWDGLADLVLLDSAGHIGYREFLHVMGHLRGQCWIVADDTRHLKHFKTRRWVLDSPGHFRVIADSTERFGFLIAHYTP